MTYLTKALQENLAKGDINTILPAVAYYGTGRSWRENAIYNSSVFLKHRYLDEWITETFMKELIENVDKSEVIENGIIKSPVFGLIAPKQLQGGVKAVILVKHYPPDTAAPQHI